MTTVEDYDDPDDYKCFGPWDGIPDDFNDRQHFVSTVKERQEYEKLRGGVPFCSGELWKWIFHRGLIDCCKAMLDGDIPGRTIDINKTMGGRLYPLDLAASALHFEMTQLLLTYGARTDLRSSGLLPINHAVRECVRIIGQSSKTSFNNLFIALCRPKMEKGLNTVRLLACNTLEVSNVFNDYAKDGKLIEMAILGIVAIDCVMPYGKASVVRESIVQEWNSLDSTESQLSAECEQGIMLLDNFNHKKAALMSASWLLNLFENAGFALTDFFHSRKKNMTKGMIIKNIKTILETEGVLMEDVWFIEDINCKNSQLKNDAKEFLAQRSRKHLGFPLASQGRFHNAKGPMKSQAPELNILKQELSNLQTANAYWRSIATQSQGVIAQALVSRTSASPAMDGTRKVMEATNKSCSWSGSRGMQVEHRSLASQYVHPARHYHRFIEPMEVQCKEQTAATLRAVPMPTMTGKISALLALAMKKGIRHV